MKKRNLLVYIGTILVISVLLTSFVPMAANAADKIKWRLAFYTGPPNDAIANAFEWWAKEVGKRTDGKMEVECFWFGSLVPAGQEFDGIKAGLFQVTMLTPAFSPSKLPLMNMQFLPCLIPLSSDTPEGFRTFMNIQNDFCRLPALTKELDRWGAQILYAAAAPEYYRLMGNVKVTSIDDLKGKKVRAIAGVGDLMKRIGATPISTSGPEMYDALSKGVVELVAHAPGLFVNMKLIEISKYYMPKCNLGHMGGVPVVNKKAYETLPGDIKKIVDEVSNEAFDMHIKFWNENEGRLQKAIKDSKVEWVDFSPESQQKLRQISHDEIWSEYVNKLDKQGIKGKETFNAFQDIIKKYIPEHTPSYL